IGGGERGAKDRFVLGREQPAKQNLGHLPGRQGERAHGGEGDSRSGNCTAAVLMAIWEKEIDWAKFRAELAAGSRTTI
ncbi:MAG TPA: hypothetical protein VJA21_16985, partial [Verrucomicrobiae bacterium]